MRDKFSKDPEKGESSKIIKELAPYMNLGLNLVITICLGVALGWWLDKTFNTMPLFLIIGSFSFSILGMVTLIRTALKANKKDQTK